MKKIKKADMLLYAVTDRSWLNGADLCDRVKEALEGGVTFVQLREKKIERERFIEEAFKIRELCHEYEVPFVINDNVDIAKLTKADGVHLGQNDMSAAEARKILGDKSIIGITARTVEQAVAAEKAGADYIGSGAVFGTSTKQDASFLAIDVFKQICHSVKIPVVAIGGINQNNIIKLKGTGAAGAAVVSSVFAASDIEKAAKELRTLSEIIFGGEDLS